MHQTKQDREARGLWGPAYDSIPKSVFATAAWHLADCCSDAGVGNGQEVARFLDEVRALAENGLISPAQAARASSALRAQVSA